MAYRRPTRPGPDTDGMDGPERLEDDARPARRATWVVVAVAVLVVATLGAVRLTGVLPQPGPSLPPGPSPASSEQPLAGWPDGVAGGTLYVLDASGVAMVDVSRGLVHRSRLRVDPGSVSLTSAGEGVLVWFDDGVGTPHLVTAASDATPTVGPQLARGRQFLAGPGDGVWTSEDHSYDRASTQRWRLMAADYSVLTTAPLAGPVQTDGAGGLFAPDEGARVVHVEDGSPTTSWRGEVGAVGRAGWEALRCAGRVCESVLHDRSSGTETPLARITSSDFQTPVLSDDNRWVASLQTSSDASDDRLVVRVAVPGQSRALRSFPVGSGGRNALVWLSDRWLAATGDTGLVLYDAVDDRIVPVGPGLDRPTQLVLRPV